MVEYEGISLIEAPAKEKLLNRLARESHAANIDWWRDPATGESIVRNKEELMMLVVSEIAEAMEGERKNLADDKLKHRCMAEVELADALIRIFDLAGGFGYDLDTGMSVVSIAIRDLTNPPDTLNGYARIYQGVINPDYANKAAELLHIVRYCARVNFSYHHEDIAERLAKVLISIFMYAGAFGYDLDGAYQEKTAYNASRKDHRLEERLKEGGKKW